MLIFIIEKLVRFLMLIQIIYILPPLYAEVRIEIVQANIYSAALYGRVME